MHKSGENRGRRQFLGQLAGGTVLAACAADVAGVRAETPAASVTRSARLPREVWIATVAQDGLRASNPHEMTRKVLARMEEVVPFEPDIVCLPEEFALTNLDTSRPAPAEYAEKPGGPLSGPIAEFARRNRCYVICPVDTRDEAGRIYNAAVLFDRQGTAVGEYRKMHPTESEIEKGIHPGPLDPPVFQTDFGKIGIQICFDMEWPKDWSKLRAKGAEIVFFPSAFAAGSMVNAMAWLNKFCVVSSTNKDTSKICDITGEEVARTSRWNRTACAAVNLEKAFLHTWPYVSRFNDIQTKYGSKVSIRNFGEEEWTILESRSPEVKVAEVLKEFGIKTHEEHIRSADTAQLARRG